MGGRGSGSWYRWDARDVVEDCRSLDVRYLHREGLLDRIGVPTWVEWKSRTDTNRIQVSVAPDRLVILSYKIRWRGGEWEDVEERVGLTWTACNFGGRRPWFLCPGVKNGVPCSRRVALLYAAGRYFLCRHCYDLTYTSTREPEYDRLLRRANKIRERLGGEPGVFSPFPDKPKGMHWRTYSRLRLEAMEAEEVGWSMAMRRFGSALEPFPDGSSLATSE